jgi:hypothetical protein
MKSKKKTKGNKVPIHATAWMNLESIMLSERSQTQKAMYHVINMKYCKYFPVNIQNRQIHRDRK